MVMPQFDELVTINITIGEKRTSIKLAPIERAALQELARRNGKGVDDLCSMVSAAKPAGMDLTLAVRQFLTTNLLYPH